MGSDLMGNYEHTTNTGSASSFGIPVHEFSHAIQSAYPRLKIGPSSAWMGEGQARAIQDLVCAHVGGDKDRP